MYVCMYGHHFQQSLDHPGMVANPALGQLNREKCFYPCFCSRLRIWSRETGSAVPSRASLLILHAQAESGAYSRDSSRFPRRRPHIPSTAIGLDPSLLGHTIVYRWRSLPRVHWHKASNAQSSCSSRCCLFRFHHGTIFFMHGNIV